MTNTKLKNHGYGLTLGTVAEAVTPKFNDQPSDPSKCDLSEQGIIHGGTGHCGGIPELQLVTVTEAARTLGIGRTLVYRLMEVGDLKYIKLGRTRRIAVAELAALIASHQIGGRNVA